MKQKYKELKENPAILIEKKIYEHQNTKEKKKILQNIWLFRGHPFVLHPAQWLSHPHLSDQKPVCTGPILLNNQQPLSGIFNGLGLISLFPGPKIYGIWLCKVKELFFLEVN